MRDKLKRLSLIMLFVAALSMAFFATGVSFAQQEEDDEASSPHPQKANSSLQTDLKISPPQPFFET